MKFSSSFPFCSWCSNIFSTKRSLHTKVGIGSRVVSVKTGTIVNRSITPVKSINFPWIRLSSSSSGGSSGIYNARTGDSIVVIGSLEFKDIFLGSLKWSLESLDMLFSFKLDYCVYLHTNDKTKNFITPPVPVMDINLQAFTTGEVPDEYSRFLSMLEDSFIYKGYFVVYSDIFRVVDYYDSSSGLINLDNYLEDVYKRLNNYTISINKSSDIKEYIEDRKSCCVVIKRIDNN